MLKLVWLAGAISNVWEDLACSSEWQSTKNGSTVWPLEHRTVIVDHYFVIKSKKIKVGYFLFEFES